jgi:hypothetical protein
MGQFGSMVPTRATIRIQCGVVNHVATAESAVVRWNASRFGRMCEPDTALSISARSWTVSRTSERANPGVNAGPLTVELSPSCTP